MKFVGVAVSVNETPARVKAFVAKHGLPGDQYFDTKGNATGAYDVPATSYVVVHQQGRQGRLHGPRRKAGPRSGDQEGAISSLQFAISVRPTAASPSRMSRTSARRRARIHHRHAQHAAAVEVRRR